MTDEEILATADACGMMLFGLGLDKAKFEFCLLAFAKQIAKLERHHEREALAQEPVAWMFQHDETGRMNYVSNDGVHNPTMFLEMNPRYALVCPLYAHSQQRTWVDLTRTQIQDVYFEVLKEHRGGHQIQGQLAFGEALQAKIKEKNT
jgi:hypothetical protein